MNGLNSQNCVSVKSGTRSLTAKEIKDYQKQIPEWRVVDIEGVKHLKRHFSFKNFADALHFTNQIGKIAEEQVHHPLIQLTWGSVTIEWWTHDVNGLHKNDFIMAAKTTQAFQNFTTQTHK